MVHQALGGGGLSHLLALGQHDNAKRRARFVAAANHGEVSHLKNLQVQ
jgi:hypothetical protein